MIDRVKNFKIDQGLTWATHQWFSVSMKVIVRQFHCGDLPAILFSGFADINFHYADFLEDSVEECFSDVWDQLKGDGIFLSRVRVRHHSVKPFKMCLHCSATQLSPNKGYFFCRTDAVQMCQDCGLMFGKNYYAGNCGPHSSYLYFKRPGQEASSDNKLQLLTEEEYNPEIRDPMHHYPCTVCEASNFKGIRFKCAVCMKVNVCQSCFMKMLTPQGYAKEKLGQAGCQGLDEHSFLSIHFNNVL